MLGLEGKEWVNSVVMYPFQYMDCTCISTNYCSFPFFNCHVYALTYRLLALQQNFKFMTFYSLLKTSLFGTCFFLFLWHLLEVSLFFFSFDNNR